jgi:hypothetical protein
MRQTEDATVLIIELRERATIFQGYRKSIEQIMRSAFLLVPLILDFSTLPQVPNASIGNVFAQLNVTTCVQKPERVHVAEAFPGYPQKNFKPSDVLVKYHILFFLYLTKPLTILKC